MKCPGCNRELAKREHAQAMTVLGRRCHPRSYCDECCKNNPWPGGTAEALNKLVYGEAREPAAT